MADRGRDLKIGILSDTSKFDLDEPIKDLDKLGESAEDTAKKVDNAFDRIAKSSRSNIRKVDDDTDRAKQGMNEFKDEADSTAKEAAASFSDVESGLEAVQEIAANAFGGFGPAGKAAGVLAAVGIGVLFKGLQDAADKANETKDRVIAMAQAASEAGGKLSSSGISEAIRDWGYAIADNKSWWELWQDANTTNIEKVQEKAEDLGLSFKDLFRGMSGSDPKAALRVIEDIDKQMQDLDDTIRKENAARKSGTRDYVTAEKLKRAALRDTREEVEASLGMSEESARLLALETQALESNVKAEEDRESAINDTIGILEAVGKAEAERADGTVKSIDEIIAAQEKEIAAKRDFLRNTTEVLDEVGQAGVDWANSFGPLAPRMMQMLASAPKKKQSEIVSNYTQIGVLAGQSTASGVVSQGSKVAKSAVVLHAKAEAALAAQGDLKIPIGVDGSELSYQARLALANLQAYYNKHPVTIPVKQGKRPIRDVP